MERRQLRRCLAEADAGSTAINVREGPEAPYLPLHSHVLLTIAGKHDGDGAAHQNIPQRQLDAVDKGAKV